MRYKQIIFDVDDTLIDFAATEDFALHSLFDANGWPLSSELQKQYHSYNQNLWRDLELGKYTYEEISERCFRVFLKQNLDIDVDGNEVMDEDSNCFYDDDDYTKCYQSHTFLHPKYQIEVHHRRK